MFYKLLSLKNVALILIFPLRWIYVIAALCGLLLLLTIVLILAKVSFAFFADIFLLILAKVFITR